MKVVSTVRFLLEPLDEESFREFKEVLAEYKMQLLYWYRKLNYKVLKKADRVSVHKVVYHHLPKSWSGGFRASLVNQLVELINLSAVQKRKLTPRINIRLHKAAWALNNDTLTIKYGSRGKSVKFKIRGNFQRLQRFLKEAKTGEPTLLKRNKKLYLCIPLIKEVKIPRLKELKPPLLIASTDINSLHGFTTVFLLFKNWSEYEVLDTIRAKPKSITGKLKALRFYQSRKCKTRIEQINANIRNQRKDFVEKLSHRIVEKTIELAEKYKAAPIIAFEDLNNWNEKSLRKILREKGFKGSILKRLAKNINSTLRGLAKRTGQKALWHEVRMLYINAKGTSKRCHICRTKLKQLTNGRYRVMKCEKGHLVERDYNAAVNIALKTVKMLTINSNYPILPKGWDRWDERGHSLRPKGWAGGDREDGAPTRNDVDEAKNKYVKG